MDIREFFASTGKVVASSGTEEFPRSLHGLIAAAVSFDHMDIAQWHVDGLANRIVSVSSLGKYGSHSAPLAADELGFATASTLLPGKPAIKSIIDMDGAQLIHNKVSPAEARSGSPSPSATPCLWQCILVSRKASRRHLISLCRSDHRADFSLGELCLLQDLTTVLWPIVERHALTLTDARSASGTTLLRSRFFDRIRERGICLSPRELEVCSALLTGRTVPELAGELVLKCSTVETYVKRATVKLGVNGRHGLTKWAIE